MADKDIMMADEPLDKAKHLQVGEEQFFVLDRQGRHINCRVKERLPNGEYIVEFLSESIEGCEKSLDYIGKEKNISWDQIRF
ncbi:hypothetical protein [Halomonas caseinilytica]|uniref:Uncharacterized protein n=1 Tax=Halomonas caseinilytica TaxID=438744 RepID=A0A1M6MMH0_9GAMM|nr:hypothetical protein [Halomonas caseinilytica]SEM37737.1 hypothetical protein SAMN04487952_103172 [Halomonas caseinilytica]SHJ84483.1 hypothetical protein SAMN05192556_10188 [Halomonas caseinilytica]